MSYGGFPYGGVAYAASDVAEIPQADTEPALAVEVSFTTDALEAPVWVDITPDVRSWDTLRGRLRELERFQPGRATIVLANRERQYDSVYQDGPWYGNLKPMRRVRIRETFNGVTYPTFDGFIDRWQLDYPDIGKDATATLIATDGFKILARAELGRSVYHETVLADSPSAYWPLDERLDTGVDLQSALNHGTLGPAGNATYAGPPLRLGEQGLIVNDPGASIFTNQDTLGPSVFLRMGVDAPGSLDVFGSAPFALECWCIPVEDPPGTVLDDAALWSDAGADALNVLFDVSAATFVAAVANDVGTSFIATSAVVDRVQRHHVVVRFVAGQTLQLWVDGVLTESGATTGTFALPVGDDLFFGNTGSSPGNNNWVGWLSQGAVYLGAAATAVNQDWVDVHYAAGTAPWQDDQPGERLDRVLDLAEWPAGLRQLDAGNVALQSATIEKQTALEHCQKVGETEFGLLFMSRDGNVRLIDRAAMLARVPAPAVFGDTAGEVGYRQFVPNDGDDTIRNRAVISRFNGVAQTTESPDSISEFGRFDYVLEGLLHRSDSYSQDYADLVVLEYQLPRRRVTTIGLGPAITGEEADLYPQMLGRELGDSIEVRNRPIGGGDVFEQICVIEGITHRGAPGGVRETTWALSPELESNTAVEVLTTEGDDPIETETGIDLEV